MSRLGFKSGFTLLETIVSMAMLSGLILLIFGAFNLASGLFQDTGVRQSAEMQLRSIKLLLQRDIELSDFWLLSKVPRTLSTEGQRDALSLSGLSDWDDSSNFDSATDRPLWNRYIVWYASLEPKATLYRQVVDPGSQILTPYNDLDSNISDVNPGGNSNVIFSRTLSGRVRNFAVSDRLTNGTVTVVVHLDAEGFKRPNAATRTRRISNFR